jgi:hypothetical protein
LDLAEFQWGTVVQGQLHHQHHPITERSIGELTHTHKMDTASRGAVT